MRRKGALAAALALAIGAAVAATASHAGAATPHLTDARLSLSDVRVGDLPADGPPALYRDEPALPAAKGWPGTEAFPRTSGTGRLDHGGFFWTDFLYDDHGAIGVPNYQPSVVAGSVPIGNYGYAPPGAYGNGADIFRTAVQLTDDATYWRVDFNTLFAATIPVAEWTFDTDNNAATGGSKWSADAGVSSKGIEKSLTVTARHAVLRDVVTNKVLADLPTTVTMSANSFVVKIPRSVLPVSRTWKIRLAAGTAALDADGFAAEFYGVHAGTAVYNVTFRSREQESPMFSYWNEKAQAIALTAQNVSQFGQTITWSELAAKRSTPEQLPTGVSDRWYASSVSLGEGVVPSLPSILDSAPNFLGRVQPYMVYVPTTYTASKPAPLTWLLHSSFQNHNQYAATTPTLIQQACEQRHSVCVSPLGRGPDGDYKNEAELDFWEVWHQAAKAYSLDPDRTVLSGYSMGGFGTHSLGGDHPDLFSAAVAWAGTGSPEETDSLRWVPVYQAGGLEDELVPVTDQQAEAQRLTDNGYRHRWLMFPVMDHVGYELLDSFADGVDYMGTAPRTLTPGHVTLAWTGAGRHDLGLQETGAYWVRDVHARSTALTSRIDAVSGGRPDRAITPVHTSSFDPTMAPAPAYVDTVTWKLGARAGRAPTLKLTLTNVSSLRVLPDLAGFGKGSVITMTITTDAPTTVRIGSHSFSFPSGTSAKTVSL